MTCKCGNYTRFLRIAAKCDDRCDTIVKHLNYHKDGYVPRVEGVGGGDYIDITVCLDCGQLQGFKPVLDEDLKQTLEIEDEEEEPVDQGEIQALSDSIEVTDMLRWYDTDIIGMAHSNMPDGPARQKVIDHFRGTRMWYKNEIISELLDL